MPTCALGNRLVVICDGASGTPAPVIVIVDIWVVTTGAVGAFAKLARDEVN